MIPKGTPPSAAAWRVWARRLAPWLVTAATIAFLLHRYPISAIREELERGDALAMIPYVAVAAVAALLLMSTADTLVFRASLGSASWRDVVCGKAGTSILLAIGMSAGSAAYAVWLGRKTRAGVRPTIGIIAYSMICDLTALCAVAAVAVWTSGDALDSRAKLILGAIAPATAAATTLAALLGPRLLRGFVRDPQLLAPWSKVAPSVFGASLLLRAVNLAIAMVTTFAAAAAFGLDIPFPAMMAYLPIIFFAGAIPINVAGFGAVQLVWVELLSPWAPGEQVLAFQFLFHLTVTAMLVARGAPFLGRVLREIARTPETTSSASSRSTEPTPGAADRGSTAT